MMYMITENEKRICRQVVKEAFKPIREDEKEVYVEKIIKITYSIGGDYSEKTFRSIAEALIKRE